MKNIKSRKEFLIKESNINESNYKWTQDKDWFYFSDDEDGKDYHNFNLSRYWLGDTTLDDTARFTVRYPNGGIDNDEAKAAIAFLDRNNIEYELNGIFGEIAFLANQIDIKGASNYVDGIFELKVNDDDFEDGSKDDVKYEYGCVMLKVERNEQWNSILESIDEEDIYESEEEPNRFGVESEPHTTVLYGLHDKEIDRKEIEESILDREPITLKLMDVSIFENDDYDVLKFGLISEDMIKFNSDLTEKYPYTNDYDYHPHITIAYLKPGTGKKYAKVFEEDEEIEIENLTEITYSRIEDGEKEKLTFKLVESDDAESEDNTEEDNIEESLKLSRKDIPKEKSKSKNKLKLGKKERKEKDNISPKSKLKLGRKDIPGVSNENFEEELDYDGYSEAHWKIDKFMPEDSDLQDEYYDITNVDDMTYFLETHAEEERMYSYFPKDGTIKDFAEYIINNRDSNESYINESNDVLDISQIRSKINELDFFFDKMKAIEDDDKYAEIWDKIESNLGEETAQILDKVLGGDLEYSSDYLHYHQNGMTGGEDTGTFLSELEDIKSYLKTI